MTDSVSPYALLKHSRPKQPEAYVTPYDLYSAAQNSAAPVQVHEPSESAFAPVPALQKTHYIADIRSRHAHASGRARMTDVTPVQPPSSCVQRPSL